MKLLTPLFLAGLILSTIATSTLAANKIVAVIDEGVILQSELDEQVKLMRQQIPAEQRASIPLKSLEKRVLDRMILTELQLQISRRSGITIQDAQVNDSIDRVAKANNLSTEEFINVLQKDGISLRSFKNSLRQQMLIRQVQASYVHHEVKVSPQEIDGFMKLVAQSEGDQASEFHLGHILIETPENPSSTQMSDAKSKAQRIVQNLNNGQKFSTLSIALSDANNALDGGDLGWMRLAQMPSLLTPYVEKMVKNEVQGPIQSPSGFHVIKLFDVRGQEKIIITKTHARHILIKTNALISDQIARERLINLKERLVNGEDFTMIARSNSDDRGSAIKGGDLGWMQPGALVPPFEAAMNTLDINQISDPVQTQFGWHIIQVLGREQKDNTDIMRRNQARMQLQKRKADEAINAWLVKLRDEAYVEYRLN